MITKEQFAAQITGREYPFQLTPKEVRLAAQSGLLVIYGASDDLIEFEGLWRDEDYPREGVEIKFDRSGILPPWENIRDELSESDAEKYLSRIKQCVGVTAIWCGEGDYSWTYQTDLPHSTFEIVEDGRPYCRGIVIDASQLK